MRIIKIDVIDAKSLQGFLDGLFDVRRIASYSHIRKTEFRGKENRVTLSGTLEPLSNQLFTVTVDVRAEDRVVKK
jgi:hypothetical protein